MLFYDISMPWDDIWAIFEDIQTASYMARRSSQAQAFRVCRPVLRWYANLITRTRARKANRIRDKPLPI